MLNWKLEPCHKGVGIKYYNEHCTKGEKYKLGNLSISITANHQPMGLDLNS